MNYLKTRLCQLLIVVVGLVMPVTVSFAQKVDLGQSFKGSASYYHESLYGRLTASGEVFTRGEFTAAHKTLPFGTMVEVIDQKTGRYVIVRINDRGPFVKGRVLDLSVDAAQQLGIIQRGVAQISFKIIGFNGNIELLTDNNPLYYYNHLLASNTRAVKIPFLPGA